MEHSKSSSKKDIHNNTSLPQEPRQISNRQSNITPTGTKKEKKNQISKTEVIKIRAEINGLETKKTIEKINESRSRFIGKISKIEKLLARLVKKKRVWPQVNKIRN